MFKIEKGVPLPVAKVTSRSAWPWKEMSVGDSVLIPADLATKARNSLAAYQSYHKGEKFTRRTLPDGLRVWRTS